MPKLSLRIDHRGARAHATENTIASFRKGLALGANAIELDVRKTRDGAIVVLHDDNLKHVFGKKDKIGELSLKEAKKLSLGKIPTLEEALKAIKARTILVELKESGIERKALAIVRKNKALARVIFISFHENCLRNIRKLHKTVPTGFTYATHPFPIKKALSLKAQYLVSLYRFTHTALVRQAHRAGLKVIVWTVNTRQEAKAMAKKGVDGITSDRPEILKGL
ncbi:MAG: glycerophosphodiester phosphodiesterase [Parcubacteria group bacterium]|nr:glycerophosphodiester phosphodiesterase [Parcubacteria group bacterium]